MNNTVKITLWDHTVGYLTWDNSDWRKETSVFKFDSSFLDKGLDISPLQMSVNSPANKAGIPLRGGNPKDIFKGLPSVFADSLPDHWGNSIFRAWAREHNVSMKSISPVDLLTFVGKRAMGALEYHPSLIGYEDEACEVNIQELYLFAKSVLDEKAKMTFSSDRELLWQDLVKLGTSPGGKRPKALISIDRTTGEIRSGQALLSPKYDYYILKYDNEMDSFPYARMEFVYWRLCKDAGIEISDSELKRFETSSHFITKRFDRGPEGKIHMQSLLAMAGEVTSYEEAFETLRKLKLEYSDFEQMYRRMVFNVLAGNIDDHARNFSFVMDKSGKWSLAPAYDMIYSIDPSVLEVQKGQFLSICGKKLGITREDLIFIGRQYDINRPGEIIEKTQDVLSKLHEYMKDEDIDESVWKMVSSELKSKSEAFSANTHYSAQTLKKERLNEFSNNINTCQAKFPETSNKIWSNIPYSVTDIAIGDKGHIDSISIKDGTGNENTFSGNQIDKENRLIFELEDMTVKYGIETGKADFFPHLKESESEARQNDLSMQQATHKGRGI